VREQDRKQIINSVVILNKSNNNYKKCIFIRNYDSAPNKNRSRPIALMISESNRRVKMNKLLVNNNNTKNCTNNFNIIFVKMAASVV
jgi:hypothetical protein